MNTERLIDLFLLACGSWRGCTWATCFGRTGLDLNRVQAWQARLMAGATRGSEAADWKAAAIWLTQVELDAESAESHAELAVEMALFGQEERALEQAEKACELEARYPSPGVWRPLLRALAAEVCALEV